MVIISFADLFATLAEGQRVGQLRRALRRATDQLFFATANEMHARQLDVIKGLSESGARCWIRRQCSLRLTTRSPSS